MPIVPSLFPIGISEDEASTRATSSTTMQDAILSAPAPPYSSGTWIATISAAFRAWKTSVGNSAFSSISAARGAMTSSARSRIDFRSSSCSSVVPYTSYAGFTAAPPLRRISSDILCFRCLKGPGGDGANVLARYGGAVPGTPSTAPRLTVIGTGYLGATHAACMAELGFEVLGLDVDPAKIEKLAAGEVPFFEPGLGELL